MEGFLTFRHKLGSQGGSSILPRTCSVEAETVPAGGELRASVWEEEACSQGFVSALFQGHRFIATCSVF